MRLHLVALVLCALSLPAAPVRAGVVSPLQGVGELPFSADLPVFFDDGGRPHVHLSARIFERDLLRPQQGGVKRLSLHVKLARSGVTGVDTVRTIEFVPAPFGQSDPAGETWTEPFRLIEMDLAVGSGSWAATLELSDADGAQSTAVGVVETGPEPGPDPGPRMSDPEFRLTSGTGTLPWPDRVYGLNQDTLVVYFEVLASTASAAETFSFEVHDPRYGILDHQELVLDLQAGRSTALWRLPVADFPEGTYGLRVVPPWQIDEAPIKEFSISWRIDRALEAGDALLVEAELALPAQDFERMQRLSRSRQIQFLDEFWRVVDPTPGTTRNETRERFVARINEANRIYHSRRGPGALSDRGRTLVRYGPPEQVEAEVMPRNGDDLEVAIGNLHNIYEPEIEGVSARAEYYGDPGTGPRVTPREGSGYSPDTASDLRRNAAKAGREGSFELWKYQYIGAPLLEHHRPGFSEQQHLRFIFVDRHGVGDFRLEYLNLPTQR